MRAIREKLRAAVLQGTALAVAGVVATAACGEKGESADEYPLSLLGCGGENYGGGFGFHGQCCFKALCYASAECLPADSPELSQRLQDAGFPPGSGRCTCQRDGQPSVSGPFSRNDGDPNASGNGNCCYVVGGIGCDGRPLMIQGEARVAPVIARSDWGAWSER